MEGLPVTMEGFKTALERAIRKEDDIDWSNHTVDYVLFKRRLKYFAERRSSLRCLIRESLDKRLPKAALINVLGQTDGLLPQVAYGMRDGVDTCITMATEDENTFLHHQGNGDSITGMGISIPMFPVTPPIGIEMSASTLNGTSETVVPAGQYIPFVDSNVSSEFSCGNKSPQNTTRPPATTDFTNLADSRGNTASDVDGHGLVVRDLSNQSSFSKTKRLKKRQIMRRVSNAERNELVLFLTWEMHKVSMFYLARWQQLSQLFVSLGPSLYLGEEILELNAFCAINIVTVRQILIRYDAFARTFEGTPILHYYMKKVTRHHTSFRKVLYHEELNALADSYSQAIIQNKTVYENFQKQKKMFQEILDRTQRAESVASTGHEYLADTFTDTFIATLRNYFLLGGIEDRLGLQPEYLTMRGQSLTIEIAQLAEWRKNGHLMPRPTIDKPKDKLSNRQLFQLTLNLIAAFLYCMNYYIVEPSSTMYVNALGAHDAMSGTLIGMTPLAALLSAVPYSIWTNKSFRYPFIVSGLLQIVGNLLYASALSFKSLELALLGRFFIGLGAPKVVIRRYMADTTPLSLRTGVNAGFGMVVAVGSAMGPAAAILMSHFYWRTKVQVPFFGRMVVFVNGMTGPGYFMAVLWFILTTVVVFTFKEPDRDGLLEQQRKEAENTSPIYDKTSKCTPHSTKRNSQPLMQSIPSMPLQQERPPEDDNFDLNTMFSNESRMFGEELIKKPNSNDKDTWWSGVGQYLELITLPVRICLALLFAKVFSIEALVSATSALSKNRYGWRVQQVGTLGCINGLLVVPLSILVGRLSMSYQDRIIMSWLVSIGCFGMFLLIDLSDLVETNNSRWNQGHVLAVGPHRYVIGYFLTYISIQSFEGVLGSALSKVIPTALASGTLNSGLLATLVDSFGRACGDIFISMVGFISLRQLMNLLFIPGFSILLLCLILIRKHYDILAV